MNLSQLPAARLLRRITFLGLLFALVGSLAPARTLRLFVVGNSFSNNATKYLPELAAVGGHTLILGKAQTGGCSFERHWKAVESFLANPTEEMARIYSGKSLHDQIGDAPWDVITMQQYSLHSSDPETYRPYAAKLHAHLIQLRPKAEVVLHQTWAYRVDASRFGQIAPDKFAVTQREMREKSRSAYSQVARQLGVRVIPTGDAFWQIDSDPQWRYQPDRTFDRDSAQPPALPSQTHSLHVGYRWSAANKLTMDANHANVAGEYLGALVWYGFLFGESPEKLTFVPPGIPPDFAAQLRKVAWRALQEIAGENKKLLGTRRLVVP